MVWDYESEYAEARQDPLNPLYIAFHDREDVLAARDAALQALPKDKRAEAIAELRKARARMRMNHGPHSTDLIQVPPREGCSSGLLLAFVVALLVAALLTALVT